MSVDEKAIAIREILPEQTVVRVDLPVVMIMPQHYQKGKLPIPQNAHRGDECSLAIAELLGLSAGKIAPQAAVVLCNGTNANAKLKMKYVGVDSCRMAKQLFGAERMYLRLHRLRTV